MVKTKIICTIGPASSNYSALRKMVFAGMDVARLNFSHGNLARHAKALNLVRTLNKKYSRRLRILGDLEGYRIRIGKLKKEVVLKKRQTIFLSNEAILESYKIKKPKNDPFDGVYTERSRGAQGHPERRKESKDD